jgi:NTE family protein
MTASGRAQGVAIMLWPMRRVFIALGTLVIGFGVSSWPLSAQGCEVSRPLALVLSGGGAKGLAHIGVLRVLDSLGVRPDLIVGTSMGSIVGAMYASGYTPSQIEAQARGLGLAQMFDRSEARAPRSLGERRPLLVWQFRSGGFRTGEAAARQAAVSSALNRVLLRGNLAARGNFDSLPIPFRAVATDLRNREEVDLAGGDLARAVRASMAVPLVFDPERIDGRDLIDGGLAANIPIAAARRAGAAQMIISDVSWRPPDSVRADDPLVVADLLVAYLFTQPLDSLGPEDRVVRPPVDSFAALDFSPTRMSEIIRRGHEAAAASFAGHAVCPGGVANRGGGAYHISRIRLAEGPENYAGLLRRQLGIEEGDWLNVPALRAHLAAIGEADDYREVWVQPSGPPDSLVLSLAVRPAPARMIVVGLSYDNDIGGQMWLGGVDRGTLFRGLEGSATLVLGELRQELGMGFRPAAVGRHPRRLVLSGMVARESVRQFTKKGDAAPDVRTREATGFLGLERRLGHEWLVTLGGFGHAWDAPGSSRSNGIGGLARVSSGPRFRPAGIWAEGILTNAYRRVEIEARQAFGLGAGITMTPGFRFGWGRNLPLQRRFPLGGMDGFSGLNIGELRGDRELLGVVLFTRRIVGPVDARLSAESGQTAVGGPTLPRGRWQAGGRLGLGAETPIGPIRLEYGVARGGRNGFFLRLGEWF